VGFFVCGLMGRFGYNDKNNIVDLNNNM